MRTVKQVAFIRVVSRHMFLNESDVSLFGLYLGFVYCTRCQLKASSRLQT